MDRFPYDTDDRDALIADLAGKELAFRKALLAAGDMETVRDVGDSVTDYLATAYDDLHDLVLGKATFEQIRDKVMADEAEVEAISQVERMEQRRAESRDDGRIARAEADREFA